MQVERVGVALRAVTDNRDPLALDQRQIGVFVVIDIHQCTLVVGLATLGRKSKVIQRIFNRADYGNPMNPGRQQAGVPAK
jgi:hypothetical protein